MLLTAAAMNTVEEELGINPLETTNPAIESLKKTFGDHTFYVGQEGLFVFEPDDSDDAPKKKGQTIRLTLIAGWTDANRKAVGKVEPQPTEMTVTI